MPIDLHEPTVWVAIAFLLFVALSFRKGSRLLLGALDNRTARIREELDNARKLREEAESVLALYKQKQTEFAREAESILAKARDDANILSAHAEAALTDALEARTKHALEKISQEESKAVADVKNHVVDLALAAARSIVVEQMGTLSSDELIKLAVADIERKIH